MKKRSLLVLSLAFLLVGCINIKRNPSSNNISNQSGGGGNSFTSSVSEEDLLAKDAYKDVTIDEFNLALSIVPINNDEDTVPPEI